MVGGVWDDGRVGSKIIKNIIRRVYWKVEVPFN